MPSIHFEFEKNEVADIVLMPGDPLRAKYIADTYLSEVKEINTVRNNLGFTGYYKGKRLSVIASGMGIPSMGIYAYELFDYYDVKTIIRLGTCGSMNENIKVKDVLLANRSYSESTFAYVYAGKKEKYFNSDDKLNEIIKSTSKENNIEIKSGLIFSTDVFEPYAQENILKSLLPQDQTFLAAEMESFALFFLANYLNKSAACVLTVSDSPFESVMLTSKERQNELDKMITLVLESVLKL
jgi:purine-nucleoside phosphorylase